VKVSSNDIYVNGQYLANNPDWDVADARWKTDVIFGLLKKNNVKPIEVIEVGCGAGENLVEFLKRDSSIEKLHGYDISPQAISLATKKASGKISFFNEDIIAKENIKTDLMLVIDVVEHVDDYYDH
jgi:2-polyprenyl-3-methyl-5-hydroxy-6-metoxy-1,4-benzoquinol methylase